MKTKLLFALAFSFFTLTFTACKKDKEVEATPIDNTTTEAGFTFKGVKYPIIFVMKSVNGGSVVYAALSEMPSGESRKKASFDIIFKKEPTANKTYKIVFPTGGSELALADDEMMITVNEPNQTHSGFFAMTENKTVELKIAGGKISASIPEVTVKYITGATASGIVWSDGFKFSANLIEK